MAMAGESSGNNTRECEGDLRGKSRTKVGLVYNETMCKHDTPDGEDHLECPDRIRVIWESLHLAGVSQRCVVLGGTTVEDKHLQLVHSNDHVNFVKTLSTKHKDYRRNRIASHLDSIYPNGGSSEAAYLAAGSVVEVAEKVAEGELDCGFAIVRPPGHHAEADKAMGFCLFNNVAVAASYLLNERPDLGIKKIMIVDWDVHHGNGTQKMFWKDPRVLFFSIHRHEHGSFYPGGDDGYYDMVGESPGEGFNINVPWEQGRCGDADYFAAWDHILLPVAKEFKPDIILLSAGFDAAIDDPLGGCRVTPYGYSVMLKKLMEFAQGKIVLALEGGYNLDSIAKSSLACVQVLLEQKPIQGSCEAYPFESTWRVIQAVRKRLCAYWPSLAEELSSKLIDQNSPTPIIQSSTSDSETEYYAHGILDQISKFNIERSARSGARGSSRQRVARFEDLVVDPGRKGELPRPSSAVHEASKLKKRPADEVIDDAMEHSKRSRVPGASGYEQHPAYPFSFPCNGLLPFVTNKLACADFCGSLGGLVQEIPMSNDYQDFACDLVGAISSVNRLTIAYDRRVLDLEKRLKEAHLSLEDERKKVQVEIERAVDAEERVESSQAELLRAKALHEKAKSRIESLEAGRGQTMAFLEKTESRVGFLEAKLKSESVRSEKLSEAKGRFEFRHGADEMMHKCHLRFDRVRQFLSARQVKEKDLMMLVQVQGSLDFVSVLVSRGVSVPTDIVNTLTADLAKWQAKVQASSVEDLDEACLQVSPLREGSSSMPIDLEHC